MAYLPARVSKGAAASKSWVLKDPSAQRGLLKERLSDRSPKESLLEGGFLSTKARPKEVALDKGLSRRVPVQRPYFKKEGRPEGPRRRKRE